MDRILGQSGPVRHGNEGIHHIPQSSWIVASPKYGLVSYPGHSLGSLIPSAERQSVYSIAPAAADWGKKNYIYISSQFFNCVNTTIWV